MKSSVRRTLVTVVKLVLGLAILVYLVFKARGSFAQLSNQRIDWPMIVAAFACTLIASSLSFVRWHLLIRALGIDIRLLRTMSLGALGLAMNFVSPGAIGGDFFKAVFLAHGHPGRRTEAVATVVADRLMGLLTMLGLASGGIVISGLMRADSTSVQVLCRTILTLTAVCWSGFAMLMLFPALSGSRVRKGAERVPLVGSTISRLLGAAHVYRSQRKTLVVAFGISIVMALFYVTSFYSVGRAIPVHEPTWTEHLVIVPTAGLVGAIPITPSGLGTTELAVEELYETMPGGNGERKGDGTMVALGRRATEVVVALIGLVFYFTHWRTMREVYAEAEETADAEEVDDSLGD
jgi:glycosyltransferase 2 family protein